jgi:hypothetical protein
MSAAPRRRSSSRHRAGRGLAAAVLGFGLFLAAPAATAAAAVVCGPENDNCVVVPDVVQTPLGQVTVTVTAGNVVTVHLDATGPNTFVLGVPFAMPPGPPVLPGYTRTSITTAGGVVDIDTIKLPPGSPTRFTLPNVAVISIHPPSPCRATTAFHTVVFTPVIPPGLPG